MYNYFICVFIPFIISFNVLHLVSSDEVCLKDDHNCATRSHLLPAKYILYDVNPPEGFNLRRDVFMRLAIFARKLSEIDRSAHWHLVLPPWNNLYHWRNDRSSLLQIPWSHFFDVDSMKRFSPVVEMDEFFKESDGSIDVVYALQNFPGAFEDGWTWEDRFEFGECNEQNKQAFRFEGIGYRGWFWGYGNMTSKNFSCVNFQGQASSLIPLVQSSDSKAIMLDRAEVVLHDWFGSAEYWQCRRSMRFAKRLRDLAAHFRRSRLNSSDQQDATERPTRWEQEKEGQKAVGGPYLAVHLRRRDFTQSRKSEVPSLEMAASQIAAKLASLELSTVFLATDSPKHEVEELDEILSIQGYRVVLFVPDDATRAAIGDGGVAIIDQIICSHARYFIGTHESTFSFRIQEEREIIGFPPDTTFNRLCGSSRKCEQPTRWNIVF